MSVIAKRRKKNIQAIEYLDKEKEVVRRVRRRKNATKNALDNGDLNINGRKMSERGDNNSNLNVKEVAKRARMRKSAEKKALENGDLHMNGTKMRRNEKMKSGEEVGVMKILKRGRG
jgi:hypothetical protein